MNTMNKLDVKKMKNYSVSRGIEIENLVFFYYCSQKAWVEEENFGKYQESKNVRCFETYEEALTYINSLESEAGWTKLIVEFFIKDEDIDEELEFADADILDIVYVSDDCNFQDDSFCDLNEYSFIN